MYLQRLEKGVGQLRIARMRGIGKISQQQSSLTGERRGKERMALFSLPPNSSGDVEGSATALLGICSQDLPPDLLTTLTTGSTEDIFYRNMKYMVGLLGSTPKATFYESYSLDDLQGFSCLGLSKHTAATEGNEFLKVAPGDDIGQWSGQTVAVLMIPTPLPPLKTVPV